MKTVTFMPSGRSVSVEPGTSILEAVQMADLPVASSCGAEGVCGKCGLRIISGSVSQATDQEQAIRNRNRVGDGLRLGCLAEVQTDLVVTADYW